MPKFRGQEKFEFINLSRAISLKTNQIFYIVNLSWMHKREEQDAEKLISVSFKYFALITFIR